MISKIIKLRTDCNITKLNAYLLRFFKKQIQDCRYIFIQLKFQSVNDNIWDVGDFTLMDLKKNKDIKSYKEVIKNDTIKYLSSEDKVNKIIIEYRELTRKEYLNHLQINIKTKCKPITVSYIQVCYLYNPKILDFYVIILFYNDL